MQALINHFIYYRPKGKGGHDDGPDAVEMLKSLLEKGGITWAASKKSNKSRGELTGFSNGTARDMLAGYN